MTTTTCVQCHAPTTYFLCTTDTATLKRWLLELASHAADLSTTVITRQTSRRGERVMVTGGSGEQPLVVDLDAAEVAWVLHNTLAAIAKSLCEDRSITYDYVDTSPVLAAWLARNVMSIALSPDALETWGMVEDVHGLVVRTVDIALPRVWLGRCDAVVDGKTCGWDVRVEVGREATQCSGCLVVHNVGEFKVRVLARMGTSTMTATELVGSLGLLTGPKADTIAKWKRRGRKMPNGLPFRAQGQTPEGADLFRVSDFLAMIAPSPEAEAD